MRSTVIAWGMFGLAIAAWGGFFVLQQRLHADRFAYIDEAIQTQAASARGDAAARLHASIQASEEERATLERLATHSIVEIVQDIENTGTQAGATNVSIGDVTPLANTPQGLSTVSVAVNADGSFAALVRALSLFEALPTPATLERFELSKSDKLWHLVARLRVVAQTP